MVEATQLWEKHLPGCEGEEHRPVARQWSEGEAVPTLQRVLGISHNISLQEEAFELYPDRGFDKALALYRHKPPWPGHATSHPQSSSVSHGQDRTGARHAALGVARPLVELAGICRHCSMSYKVIDPPGRGSGETLFVLADTGTPDSQANTFCVSLLHSWRHNRTSLVVFCPLANLAYGVVASLRGQCLKCEANHLCAHVCPERQPTWPG